MSPFGGNIAGAAVDDEQLSKRQLRAKRRKEKQKQKKLATNNGNGKDTSNSKSAQEESAAAAQHSPPPSKKNQPRSKSGGGSANDNSSGSSAGQKKWCVICGADNHWCQDCPGSHSSLPPYQPSALMSTWHQYPQQNPPSYRSYPSNNQYQFSVNSWQYSKPNNESSASNLYNNRGIVGVTFYSSTAEQQFIAVAALDDFQVMMDNGATCGVFKNAQLLHNLRMVDRPCIINGIGGKLETQTVGDFMGMTTVYYHPDALANILSQSTLSDEGHQITYNHRMQTFHLVPVGSNHAIEFKRHGGLYCFDTRAPDLVATSVARNKQRYTKREIKRAEEARRVQKRLGYPSDERIPHMTTIQNIPVTRSDIVRAKQIWGPHRALLRGKMRLKKPPAVIIDDLDWKPTEIVQDMAIDVFFIDGDGYLLSVLSPLDYSISTHLKNRETDSIRSALNHQFALINEQDYTVRAIMCDGEGGVLALYDELRDQGYVINPFGAGEHVPVVERKIDTLKGRIRSCLMGLDYQLMFSLLRYLVEYATIMVNLEPCSKREDPTSPWELFHGRKIDYKRHLKLAFGDYAEVKELRHKSNSMNARSQPCIALLPVLNYQGSWLFFNLRTRRTAIRHQWTELPVPEDVIDRLHELAGRQAKTLREQLHFSRSKPLDEQGDLIDHIDDDNLFDANDVNQQPAEEDESDDEADESNSESSDGEQLRDQVIAEREEQLDIQNPSDPDEEFDPHNLMQEATIPAGPVHRYSTRSRGNPITYGPYTDGRQKESYGLYAVEHVYGNMTIAEAIDCYGEPAKVAVIKEMTQLIRLGVFRFRDWRTLTIAELKSRIPSKTFVKLKYLADGTFDKFKARTVAGGHRQNRSLYTDEETSSPTISLVGLFIIASIAAAQSRHVITADIGGAYLRALMKRVVLMILGREESSVLVSMYPELSPYLDTKGRLTVELAKALYGCIESSRLWYDTFRAKLEANGYKCNPYDPCIFNKWHELERVQSTIGIHVDDCFISCSNLDIAEGIVQFLHEEFEELNVVRGLVHSYTGMMLDFSVAGIVRVTMNGIIGELLQKCNITTSAPTPAKDDLFLDDPNSPALDAKRRELFHSIVASCAYIGKRIKPETLVAVSKLASRVNCSTEKDWRKLQRLLKYIHGTRNIPLCLEMTQEPVQVIASIDSSHAVHGECRGQTGISISIGRGTVQSISVKQPINTKSSAETELVGLSDGATPAINVQNILIEQGIAVVPLLIHQDNQSTLSMIVNGRAMGPTTRHINIRLFWLTDRITSGEVRATYVPTEDITADALSKPLQGGPFLKHRATLLNIR